MNKVQFAQAFGVSTNTITEWVTKGCPCEKRGRHGDQYNFELPAVIAWRVEQLVRQVMGPMLTGETTQDAIRREAFAKAELRELELAEKKGVLMNTELAAKIIERGILETRSQLLALPTKLAPRLIAYKTPAQIKQVLDKAVRDALEGICRIKFSEDVLEEHMEEMGAAADADRERVGGSPAPAQPGK